MSNLAIRSLAPNPIYTQIQERKAIKPVPIRNASQAYGLFLKQAGGSKLKSQKYFYHSYGKQFINIGPPIIEQHHIIEQEGISDY